MLVSLLLSSLAHAQACPTPGDCDEDGWTVLDGDCDDSDPLINPGRQESCGNDFDDDCDRLYNEGCPRDAQQGMLGGGRGCGADEQAPIAGLFLLPLLLPRRRRC
ncbi:MAG: hypothetical protein KC656_14700 [Myxococcales bacterium]|nr:hypothetical protein [Myxococcales bacterium]MCB9672921.1 hypothetical protein [Alphaproteobacteria bacterium]